MFPSIHTNSSLAVSHLIQV